MVFRAQPTPGGGRDAEGLEQALTDADDTEVLRFAHLCDRASGRDPRAERLKDAVVVGEGPVHRRGETQPVRQSRSAGRVEPERDQFVGAVGGQVGARHDHQRRHADHLHQPEILALELDGGVGDGREDQLVGRALEQVIAVGLGRQHLLRAQRAADAAQVLHQHGLTQLLGNGRGDDPGDGIGRASGRVGHHHHNGPIGIVRGPGALARAIVGRIGHGHVLAIDRSETAIRQAIAGSKAEIAAGMLAYRCIAAEDFTLEAGEYPFDMAVAIRVGAFDGRHPEPGRLARARLAKALVSGGPLFIDGGDPLTIVPFDAS